MGRSWWAAWCSCDKTPAPPPAATRSAYSPERHGMASYTSASSASPLNEPVRQETKKKEDRKGNIRQVQEVRSWLKYSRPSKQKRPDMSGSNAPPSPDLQSSGLWGTDEGNESRCLCKVSVCHLRWLPWASRVQKQTLLSDWDLATGNFG